MQGKETKGGVRKRDKERCKRKKQIEMQEKETKGCVREREM